MAPVNKIAYKFLKNSDIQFNIYRNNQFVTITKYVDQMSSEVDSFIETRSNAIKETVTSVKIEDVKSEGGHKHKKKTVKKEKV